LAKRARKKRVGKKGRLRRGGVNFFGRKGALKAWDYRRVEKVGWTT